MISPTDPAFPCTNGNATFAWNGMDTRTYLAGVAMQGLLARQAYYTAEEAVRIADRLIEVLNAPAT